MSYAKFVQGSIFYTLKLLHVTYPFIMKIALNQMAGSQNPFPDSQKEGHDRIKPCRVTATHQRREPPYMLVMHTYQAEHIVCSS